MKRDKKYFDPVDPKCNFVNEENILLKNWYEKGIVEKYLKKNRDSKKRFSFLDGPITANNPMGVHHAWGRTYKDIFQRYKNMRGYRQRFQNGFDCQGLWVEVEVEKELGFKTKKEIDSYGVAKFVQKCKDRVNKYSLVQTDQSKRLGNFMDWDNSYFTMSDDNNYMIWYFLKLCSKKGLIYKGKDVVPWCFRCETAISEHEILTEDYKEIEHKSVYMRLPIIGRDKEYLLVWTTTPWTIPANIAVAVDAKSIYSLVEADNRSYWIMKNLVKEVFKDKGKILRDIKGSELVGLRYKYPFDDLPSNVKVSKSKLFHTVIATDPFIMPITDVEGTGLVHTSTATGAEDHRLGKKLGLPIIPAISEGADYLSDFGYLAGKNAKKHPEIILDILSQKEQGEYLFMLKDYKHRYPVCWRCKNELVWKLTDEWYIRIDPVREDMKKITKKIKWIPPFGLKRELDWLSNMHDWLISKKNRYWGLALPIWECECGEFEVIGGYEELKERAVEGWKDFEGHTPHKPYIDMVKIKCKKCGKIMSRISDVGNPWLDAGIVPFSTISNDNKSEPLYLRDRKEFFKWYPCDFITESFPGQFKNWFYSVLAMSTIMENEIPYKTVLGFATLFGEDGKAMHKSLGNSIEFNEGAEKIGADVMRWMFSVAKPSKNLLFGYKIADEARRRFYLKLWNIYNFFITYANIDGYVPQKHDLNSENVLDKWLLMKLSDLLGKVEKHLDEYKAHLATQMLEEFVDDMSNWYIRRSRNRVGPMAEDLKDRESFYNTSYTSLLILSQILAPFLPFISEIIYKNLTKRESVHLDNWPKFIRDKEQKIIDQMESTRNAVEVIHSERKSKGIAIRQPLEKSVISAPKEEPDEEYLKLLADEVNVFNVVWEKKGTQYKASLDTKITPRLEEFAKTRELIRRIQNERKKMQISLTDTVEVSSEWMPENPELIIQIKRKTLAGDIKKGSFSVTKHR